MKGLCTNTLGEREYEGLRLYALVVGGFRDFRETHKQSIPAVKMANERLICNKTRLDSKKPYWARLYMVKVLSRTIKMMPCMSLSISTTGAA